MKDIPWGGQFSRRPGHQAHRMALQVVRKFWSKTRQNRILSRLIFSSPCPCCPELTQVCCCLHNLGEETEPLSAETSGAKACGWTDTPSWFSVPWSPVGQGTMESFGLEIPSLLHAPAS